MLTLANSALILVIHDLTKENSVMVWHYSHLIWRWWTLSSFDFNEPWVFFWISELSFLLNLVNTVTLNLMNGWGTSESQTFQSTPSVPDSTVQWQNELFSPRLYSPELFSPRPFSLELFSPRPFSPELFSPRLYSPMEKWTFQSQTFQSWTLQSKTFQSWTFQSQTFQSQTLQSQGQNELFSPRPKRQLF